MQATINRLFFWWTPGRRLHSAPFPSNRTMRAWQFDSYGAEPLFRDNVSLPQVSGANDVLVKISAVSLNPIDVAMSNGYAASVLNLLRKWKSDSVEFPLTLGRDFVGEVVERGDSVRKEITPGAKVWGTVPNYLPGTLAEYVAVDASFITNVPNGVDDIQAASVPYAGLTAWTGLFLHGKLGSGSGSKRVCVLGASGGVGNLAVQMARAEGADVVATCSADSAEMVTRSGAHTVIDYRLSDADQRLAAAGPFDIVLDCASKGPSYATQVPWSYGRYVSFTTPAVHNFDKHGLIFGGVRSVMTLTASNVHSLWSKRGLIKWAIIQMKPEGLEYLRKLVETKKINAMIDSTFDFKDTDAAFRKLKEGHLRGKIVIRM